MSRIKKYQAGMGKSVHGQGGGKPRSTNNSSKVCYIEKRNE